MMATTAAQLATTAAQLATSEITMGLCARAEMLFATICQSKVDSLVNLASHRCAPNLEMTNFQQINHN